MKLILQYVDGAFCLLMAVMIYVVFPLGRWFDESAACTILLVGFYYLSYTAIRNIVVPTFFRGGWWSIGAFSMFVGMVLLMCALTSPHEGWPFGILTEHHEKSGNVELTKERAWLIFLTEQSFGLAVAMLSQLARDHIRLLEAERDRDRMALSLYRAQLNPHFLYNTLNSLYALIVSGNDKAERVLMQIVDMARATSQMTMHEFITVDKEFLYIRNYIELQRLRMERPERIKYEYSRCREAMIAPMLLTTFVGNALKYGARNDTCGDVNIVLSVDEQAHLTLDVVNPICPDATTDTDKEAGTGIENSRRRLALLYPNRHTLTIRQHDNLFEVHLEIEL